MISSGLLTDSYQLAMLQAYLDAGMTDTAVFEFFVRRLPASRNFLIAAGAEQVLEFLESLRFTSEEIAWLRSTGHYRENALSYLEHFKFTGEVWAMPEGTPFFANEPILRVTAPIPQAQLVETRIINLLQFQVLIASKAARSVLVSEGKLLVDFGLRRAHGSEAGLLAARASYLAGFHGTSVVLAGVRFGIPVFGTMAHSFIQAQESEAAAFAKFAESNPTNTTLLIDTYDTEVGAAKVVALAPRLSEKGIKIHGVRLDSGDLAQHARQVRRVLDHGGLKDAQIFVSGSVDEFSIQDLLRKRAPVDGFGVGTHMTTSEDEPYLDCAYKLEEYAAVARRKRSEGKATWPGAKQVYRQFEAGGTCKYDVLQLTTEAPSGTALLEGVMRNGKRLVGPVPVATLRQSCLEKVNALPGRLKSIINPHEYEVRISEGIRILADELDAWLK